jgi:hypothetical protein
MSGVDFNVWEDERSLDKVYTNGGIQPLPSRRDSGGACGGDDNDDRVARGGCSDRRIPTAVEGVASKMVTVVVFESAGNGFLLFCFDSFLFLTVFGFFFFFFNFGFGL